MMTVVIEVHEYLHFLYLIRIVKTFKNKLSIKSQLRLLILVQSRTQIALASVT